MIILNIPIKSNIHLISSLIFQNLTASISPIEVNVFARNLVKSNPFSFSLQFLASISRGSFQLAFGMHQQHLHW